MVHLVLTLLVIAIVFAVCIVLGGTIALRWINTVLSREQETLDWVVSAGLAPPSWSTRERRILAMTHRLGAPSGLETRIKRLAKRRMERRLLGLIRSIERSNVITEEGLRNQTTATLREIGRRWESSSWEEVVGDRSNT